MHTRSSVMHVIAGLVARQRLSTVPVLACDAAWCEGKRRMEIVTCHGCGSLFPDVEGPAHRYMASSPGCWAAFGEVLAREYSDLAYFAIHRLTVDAYAAQHPGQPSPQSIKSVGVHLVRLHLLLECGLEMQRANDAMLAINQAKQHFVWLDPPPALGAITVADVHQAEDVGQHIQMVKAWAASVWAAWSPHHEAIRRWAPPLGSSTATQRRG